jgi:hypothetical protein
MNVTLDFDTMKENKNQYITIAGIVVAIIVLYFVFIK